MKQKGFLVQILQKHCLLSVYDEILVIWKNINLFPIFHISFVNVLLPNEEQKDTGLGIVTCEDTF